MTRIEELEAENAHLKQILAGKEGRITGEPIPELSEATLELGRIAHVFFESSYHCSKASLSEEIGFLLGELKKTEYQLALSEIEKEKLQSLQKGYEK